MAKQKFPPTETKNAFGAHGHARDNGPASEYTGFKYPTGGGNDIGIYKQPMPNPNPQGEVYSKGSTLDDVRISVGNNTKSYPGINPYGVKQMRGYGAATKGRKISGKQG